MPHEQAVTFHQALESVEALPDEQQEELIEIVRRRRIERRREAMANSIQEARREYARGEVRSGSVDDLLADLEPDG